MDKDTKIADLEAELVALRLEKSMRRMAENKNIELLQQLNRAQIQARHYAKLRRWMTSNVKEGWSEVERIAAVGCYLGWHDFDQYLDSLPECNLGLCSITSSEATHKQKPIVYLAGPDVFRPNAIEYGESLKATAIAYGLDPLFPMDNLISPDSSDPSGDIYSANVRMINSADMVIANLNDFRGPEPDSGTVWEVGYALGLGKRVVGYISSGEILRSRVLASENRADQATGLAAQDSNGLQIEDFGHPLNLMLMHSIHLVIGSFEDACTAAAAKFGTSRS